MSDSPIEVLAEVRGAHGKGTVYHMSDGFLYIRHQTTASAVYFRCNKYRAGCSARITFHSYGINTSQGNHDHDASSELLYKARRLALINQAKNSEMSKFQDVFNHPSNIELTTSDPLFAPHRLLPSMIRARASILPKCETLPQLSTVLSNPEFACITKIDEQQVLYRGSVEAIDRSHVILFMTRKGADFLKIVPVAFILRIPAITLLASQNHFEICIVGGIWDKSVMPAAWFLLERYSFEALSAAFELLRLSLGMFRFSHAIGSMDVAATAFSRVFSMDVHPSLFNFIHDILLSEVTGFTRESLNENVALKYIVSLSCALPLLPTDRLQTGINVVINEAIRCGVHNQAAPLFHYIEEHWLKRPHRKFSICGDVDRTNYGCEDLRHRVITKLGNSKADFYSIIRSILYMSEKSDADIENVLLGRSSYRPVPLLAHQDVVNLLKYVISPPFTVHAAVQSFLVNISEKLKGFF